MPPKPSRPRTGSGRPGPRGIDQAGELIDPEHTPAADNLSSPPPKAGRGSRYYADTAMREAFLRALIRWAERHATTDKITLPTGTVADSELVLVLRALHLIQPATGAPANEVTHSKRN
jgi:hypothetical protein